MQGLCLSRQLIKCCLIKLQIVENNNAQNVVITFYTLARMTCHEAKVEWQLTNSRICGNYIEDEANSEMGICRVKVSGF